MTIFQLIFEFFKTGLFSLGGGYATIPFLYRIMTDYGWYTSKQLTNMIAISMLTPGPVGANMATFAGFQTFGIIGGIIATLALVMPSYILIILISKILKTFKENFYTKAILYALKPAGCALLCSVACSLIKSTITDIYALILLITLFILSFKLKKNPLIYIAIASLVGLICC